jgi:hypothetical protein
MKSILLAFSVALLAVVILVGGLRNPSEKADQIPAVSAGDASVTYILPDLCSAIGIDKTAGNADMDRDYAFTRTS